MTSKAAILQAIRHKCLDCSVYQPAEVRECPVSTCGLWPFRFGADPDPCRTRGFAKSRVYTDDSRQDGDAADLARLPYTTKGLQQADSGARRLGGTPEPAGGSFSEIGLLEADLEKSGACCVGGEARSQRSVTEGA